MHKRQKMHNMHVHGPQGISHVHNMHDGGAQYAFSELSGVHNMHIPDAQYAPLTCIICIPAPFDQPRHARPGVWPDSHYSWTNKDEPARDDPETTKGRLMAAPSHIPSGLAARLTAKSTSGRRRASRFAVQSSHGMRRPLRRAASISLGGTCAQNGILPPLPSDLRPLSLSKIDLRGIWLCAHRLPDCAVRTSRQHTAHATAPRPTVIRLD